MKTLPKNRKQAIRWLTEYGLKNVRPERSSNVTWESPQSFGGRALANWKDICIELASKGQ